MQEDYQIHQQPEFEEIKQIPSEIHDVWDSHIGQHTRSKDFSTINDYEGNKFVLRKIDPHQINTFKFRVLDYPTPGTLIGVRKIDFLDGELSFTGEWNLDLSTGKTNSSKKISNSYTRVVVEPGFEIEMTVLGSKISFSFNQQD